MPTAEIKKGDHVDVTLVKGNLIDYIVEDVPGKNQIYWTLYPDGNPGELTVIGPSLIAITKRE